MSYFSIKAVVIAASALVGVAAHADSGTFACISSPSDCSAASGNNITWSYDGATFTITNGGPSTWFVGDVYFDFATATPVGLIGGAGTSFSTPATPGALPGGDAYTIGAPGWDSGWSAAPPPSANGINGGESASWSFASTNYVAGIHLQGLPTGASASLIAVSAVPESQTYVLMLTGLGVIAFVARRRRT